MTLGDLIRRFRALADDNQVPYFFTNEEVTDWLNDAQAQACIRGRLIREDELPSVCRIALATGKHTYKLHKTAYELITLRLVPANGERPRTLDLVSREVLNQDDPQWRDDTRPATRVIQDDTTIRVLGGIANGDVLELECYRLPMAQMEDEADEPEIHGMHHQHLVQWALHRAFSVPDADFFDANRSAKAEEEFTAYFGPLPDSDARRITREDQSHHNVAILP